MPRKKIAFVVALISLTHVTQSHASQQCRNDLYSIYQMMLRGHTYKTFKAQARSLDCRNTCLADVRCQSYNVVMFENLCELNNRSKEARPGDFIENESRYHVCIVSERGINTKKCTVFFFKWLHMLVFAADYIRRTISRLTLTLWSLTSREALTMYCSVVKHAGSGSESTKKCREKHECFSPLLECSYRFLITVRY